MASGASNSGSNPGGPVLLVRNIHSPPHNQAIVLYLAHMDDRTMANRHIIADGYVILIAPDGGVVLCAGVLAYRNASNYFGAVCDKCGPMNPRHYPPNTISMLMFFGI